MAWIDTNDMFWDNVALTADAISSVKQVAAKNVGLASQSNTTVDLGAVEDLWCVIRCDTTADSTNDTATAVFSLISDSVDTLDSSATTHYTTASLAIGSAALTAGGTIAAFRLPPGNYEKYLGIKFDVSTQDWTAGKVTAFLTNSRDVIKYYAAGSIIGS